MKNDDLNDLKYVSKEDYKNAINDIETKLSLLQQKFEDFSEGFGELKEVVKQLTETMSVIVYQDKTLEAHSRKLEKLETKMNNMEKTLVSATKDKLVWFWRTFYLAMFLLIISVLKNLGIHIEIEKIFHFFGRWL